MKESSENGKSLKERAKEGKLSKEELASIKKGVKRAESLAFVLDTTMLDPILGLFEGAGDAATGIAGLYIVYQAKKAGMSNWELGKMIGRQGLDFLVGDIPIIGDIFDFVYKSNKKNAAALRAHFEKIDKECMKQNLAKFEKEKIGTEKGTVKKLDGIKIDRLKKDMDRD